MLIATLCIATVLFVSFSAAVKIHFKSTAMPFAMKIVSVLSVVSFAYSFFFSAFYSDQHAVIIAALPLFLLSAFTFLSAISSSQGHSLNVAFHRGDPSSVLMSGIFGYVRHPFYLSYILFWSACFFVTLHPISAGFAVVLGLIYIYAAKEEEKYFLNSSLCEDYKRYQVRAGFMWPKVSEF